MPSVLVVDDDELTGSLSSDLLREGGFDVDLVSDSLQVIDTLRKKSYQGVVLDILMPGIDGLTLCHKIKTDPETKHIKVIMVSGKSFESEQQKAKQLGASGFIIKPYDVNTFAKTIAEIIGSNAAASSGTGAVEPPAISPAAESSGSVGPAVLSVKILGSRAKNIPTPSLYGTHTPAILLSYQNHALIFDAGSGLNFLNQEFKNRSAKEIRIFLTHFHQNHVEGLLSFSAAQTPDTLIHIAAAPEPGKSIPALLQEVLKAPGKPLPKARFELHELRERSYKVLPNLVIHAFHANHPGTSLGFSIEAEGRKVVYSPDAEIYGSEVTAFQDYDEKFSGICRNADLLIHDAQFTQEDYEKNKTLGHSGFLNIVDLAIKANVKRLILFHQDSLYSDSVLDQMVSDAKNLISQKSSPLVCEVAKEGTEISV
jgi:CheY-like chemotaxis protein